MPPGIGYPQQQPVQGQPQQPGGLFQDVSQIPPQLQQQLYRQFLGEQLGFIPPSPPGAGGGVFNFQPSQDFRQPQMAPAPAPQQAPQQAQQRQRGPQQPKQGQVGQQPQQPPVQAPPLPPAQPVIPQPAQPVDQGYMWSGAQPAPIVGTAGVQGPFPNTFSAGIGQTISANSSVADPMASILFGG